MKPTEKENSVQGQRHSPGGDHERINYLREMADSGYCRENIGAFHRICLPYLGQRYFPDQDSRILDVGAGQGHCLFPLKESGYENLLAADIDDSNKELFESNGIQFIQLDAENAKFPLPDDALDVVLLFHVIEHLKNASCLLGEVRRMLKSDGVFILVTPDWRKQFRTFYRDHTHVRPYDKVSVSRLLRCFGFDPLLVKGFGVFPGIGRAGIWKAIKPLLFTGNNLIAVSKARERS